MEIAKLVFPLADVPADVGAVVAAERGARKWTQARLARKAGLSRSSIYRLEGGARPARADTLFRIAHALDIPIASLVPAWPEWEPIKGHRIGDAVRERRRALGMTLAQLTAKLGVSVATLSRHERGIGISPTFVKRVGDDHVECNPELAGALRLTAGLDPGGRSAGTAIDEIHGIQLKDLPD